MTPKPWSLPPFAIVLAAPAASQPHAVADSDAGWETHVEIKKLSFDFAANPEKATMSSPGWTIWPKVPEVPPELRRRTFLNESYLLVDIGPLGRAVACRPLRASALPRLDAESCALLKRPDAFSIALPQGTRTMAPQQTVIGVSWRRSGPDSPRFTVAEPPPTEKKP